MAASSASAALTAVVEEVDEATALDSDAASEPSDTDAPDTDGPDTDDEGDASVKGEAGEAGEEGEEGVAKKVVADDEPDATATLGLYAREGGGLLVVQPAAPGYVKTGDPLILALDASSSNRALDLGVLGEALTRLFTYLSQVRRRVTILVFHSEVLVLHPAEEHVFPLMTCTLESAAPLVVREHMTATIGELHTALNQPIAAKNVAFLVKAYMSVVRAGGAAAVHHTWITSTLRLAAAMLRHVATRTAHGQVLLVCDGGEFYGRDAAGRQGFLEAAGIVAKLVPAFGTLPCTVSVSALALGPAAELDTLGAIAYALDGVLTYARGAKELGGALVEACKFLARRPTQLLLTLPAALVGTAVATDAASFPHADIVAARAAYVKARARQLLGEDAAATEWVSATPTGAVLAVPDGVGVATADGDADAETMPLLIEAVVPPAVAAVSTRTAVARAVAAALYPLMSWRTKVAAAADTPALTATLAALAERVVGVVAWAPLHQLVAARARGDATRDAAKAVFVRALQLAHAFPAAVTVKPEHVALLEALPVDSSVLEARAEFERVYPRWVAAQAARADRYTCHLMHDALEMAAVPVCTRGTERGATLWAPFAAKTVPPPAACDAPEPIRLGSALVLDDTHVVGLHAHAAALGAGAGAGAGGVFLCDVTGCDGHLAPKTDDAGNIVAGDQVLPKGSRAARAAAAVVEAHNNAAVVGAAGALPLFLQLEDAMNPYTSMEASKALAALANGADDAWQDPLLPARVYGALVSRWLAAAVTNDVDATAVTAAKVEATEAKVEATEIAVPDDFEKIEARLSGGVADVMETWNYLTEPRVQMLADVCRSLAITAETHLVSDMYARFIKGTPSKDELARAQAALAEAEEAEAESESETESETESDSAAKAGAKAEAVAKAKATLAAYESKAAWRGPEVVEDVVALGAILALYRSPQEYSRAKQAAIKEYVDGATKAKKREEAATEDAEVERRLRSTLAARAARGLAPADAHRRAYFRKVIRRALAEEGGVGAGAGAGEGTETEGAKLDEDAKKEEMTKAILHDMPPDAPLAKHLKTEKFKIGDFATACVPVIEEALVARGASTAYARAMGGKLRELWEVGDALVQTVPANARLCEAVRRIFSV